MRYERLRRGKKRRGVFLVVMIIGFFIFACMHGMGAGAYMAYNKVSYIIIMLYTMAYNKVSYVV